MVKRLDPSGLEENKDVDTRRWQQTDNKGHFPASNQAHSNEEQTEEMRQKEDESRYNELDVRSKVSGNEQV